jgi:DNA-binding MarR family transcriptional regulator
MILKPGTLPRFLTRAGFSLKSRLEERFQNISPVVTLPQYVLLHVLDHRDGLTQNEIAARAFKDKTNVARILAALEEENLILRRKDPEDLRSYRVYLTDSGRNLVLTLQPIIEQVVREAAEGIPASDLEATYRTLQKIYLNLQTNNDKDSNEQST